LKLQHRLPECEALTADAAYFIGKKMYRFAGEVYYVQGAYRDYIGEESKGMQLLKQAERLFEEAEVPDILRGMVYYKMGRVSETEQLYEVALRYYEEAVPYLDRAGLPLYAACGWRELARTSRDSVVQKDAFARSLRYAEALDTLTQLDIRYAALSRLDPQSEEIIRISRYLCDSAGIHRFAYDLVRYYLKENSMESAKKYLEVLATDTLTPNWSKDKYAFLLSRYQRAKGQNAQAYETLLSLYNKQSGEIEASGMTRTFTIAEQFDNQSEREKNLQLQVEKQRLYMALFGVLLVILTGLIVAIVIVSRRRAAHLVEAAETQMQIERLHAEVEIRRASMGRLLMQRIQLSKSMQESMKRHKEDKVPACVQEFVETNLIMTDEQWASFRDEFNANYSNFLTRLKAEHPALTSSDLQVIALTVLGVDISDICRLLNLTKRTVWGRRLRIKDHLGLTPEDQLDDWLQGNMSSAQ
jgi:tetratricopeptide (TPR) repeat protein